MQPVMCLDKETRYIAGFILFLTPYSGAEKNIFYLAIDVATLLCE